MKILFVIGTLGMGGAEKQLVQIANQISNYGFEVHIGVLNLGIYEERLKLRDEIYVHDLNLRFFQSPTSALKNLPRFINLIKTHRFHYVYAFMPEAVIISFPFVRFFSPKTIRVAGIRGSLIRRGALLRGLFKLLLRKSHYVIFNSKPLAKKYEQEFRLNPLKIKVIHNGVDLEMNQARCELEPPNGIVISNFHSYKGYETLIYAIAQVKVECHFNFIGEGAELNSMKTLVKTLGIEKRINFLGNVDPKPYLVDSQFAVHPSVSEGLSNAILEEISFGLPVIASDIPENYALIVNQKNGFLAKPNSVSDLAEFVAIMAGDAKLRTQMGLESRKKSLEFSWENCASSYLDFFGTVHILEK